jgi:bifunctional enzyme Fae/Hps
MAKIVKSHLSPKKSYLQVALNSTLEEAQRIIFSLPKNERVIIEAGTPLIKQYGEYGIRQICTWYAQHLSGNTFVQGNVSAQINSWSDFVGAIRAVSENTQTSQNKLVQTIKPYVVADLKTMDRADTEVTMAARAGASAAIALGIAPIETLNTFIDSCEANGLDAMIDMMNVEYPLAILQKLRKIPPVVIIHRGVDEEALNREKQIPLHEIRRIKGMYDIMISIAGGDTIHEVQRSVFNDADIVVIWKSVYKSSNETIKLVEGFLTEMK